MTQDEYASQYITSEAHSAHVTLRDMRRKLYVLDEKFSIKYPLPISDCINAIETAMLRLDDLIRAVEENQEPGD